MNCMCLEVKFDEIAKNTLSGFKIGVLMFLG